MTLESLTLQQIVRFANSEDIDAAQFGHRVLRLMKLAVKNNPTDDDVRDIRNLDEVLRKDVANRDFVAHLNDATFQAHLDDTFQAQTAAGVFASEAQ
jgi:hypothetical protein